MEVQMCLKSLLLPDSERHKSRVAFSLLEKQGQNASLRKILSLKYVYPCSHLMITASPFLLPLSAPPVHVQMMLLECASVRHWASVCVTEGGEWERVSLDRAFLTSLAWVPSKVFILVASWYDRPPLAHSFFNLLWHLGLVYTGDLIQIVWGCEFREE